MNEDELVKQLKQIKPKPSKHWEERTIKSFDILVTNYGKKRNRLTDIFYFLKLSNMSTRLKTLAIVGIITTILFAGAGSAYASDQAVPGDLLYGLDKSIESIQRAITTDPVAKAELELSIMDERVAELEELSEGDNLDALSESISEVEAQQIRLQERLQEMDQLRLEDKLQTQEQQIVMEQLQEKVQIHEQTLEKIQTNLQSKGDQSNSDNLEQIQNKYFEQTGNQLKNFEAGTGVNLQNVENESNQNQNDGTQYNQEKEQETNQNTNQINQQGTSGQQGNM